jgi:hypothetical protein
MNMHLTQAHAEVVYRQACKYSGREPEKQRMIFAPREEDRTAVMRRPIVVNNGVEIRPVEAMVAYLRVVEEYEEFLLCEMVLMGVTNGNPWRERRGGATFGRDKRGRRPRCRGDRPDLRRSADRRRDPRVAALADLLCAARPRGGASINQRRED